MIQTEPMIREVENIDWEVHLASRTQRMKSSVIRELLKLTMQPDVISFAGGLPAPQYFPVKEFQHACNKVLEENGPMALQYGPTEGYAPLKQDICDQMCKYGILVEPENVLITSGSQQALDLIGKLFVDQNHNVICSRPTYLGALQAWNAYEATYHAVPLDDDGMRVDMLPELLKGLDRPGLIYVLPNFHNPGGTTLSQERREMLVKIARQHDLVIIEDDPYGELRYEGEDLTPLFRMAPERTIYLSTFSKTLAPGLRLAWITAPKPLITRFVQAKQGADLHTGTFVQYVAHEVISSGFIRKHVRTLRKVYSARRDAMLDALTEFMPEETNWSRPEGGMFLWARCNKNIKTGPFMEKAVAAKVAYVPGFAFYPNEDGGASSMRLNFSYCDEETIVEGVRRLGTAMKKELAGK